MFTAWQADSLPAEPLGEAPSACGSSYWSSFNPASSRKPLWTSPTRVCPARGPVAQACHSGRCSRWGRGWHSAPARWQLPCSLGGLPSRPLVPPQSIPPELVLSRQREAGAQGTSRTPVPLSRTVLPCPFPAPLLPNESWGELASEAGQGWRRLKGLLSRGKVFVRQGRPTSRAPECAEQGRPEKESAVR